MKPDVMQAGWDAADGERRLRLAVISLDDATLPDLDEFDVQQVDTPIEALGPEGPADIIVLDVRSQDRVSDADAAVHLGRPVVVIGDEHGIEEQLRYLDAGVDEYVCSDVEPLELAARLRSVARRHARMAPVVEGEPDCHGAGVTISLDRYEVRRDGRLVHLTPAEFRLLAVLTRHANQVVPHYKLAGEVWGGDYSETRAHLRVHVRHLRQKLERDPDEPRLILTERGRGYRLDANRVPRLRWAS